MCGMVSRCNRDVIKHLVAAALTSEQSPEIKTFKMKHKDETSYWKLIFGSVNRSYDFM